MDDRARILAGLMTMSLGALPVIRNGPPTRHGHGHGRDHEKRRRNKIKRQAQRKARKRNH